jgi:co-chaperonin GroES (HSP10)
MEKKIEAKGKIVIVEINSNKEKKSEGGIFMPAASDRETQNQAIVVSVGPEVTDIKAGDLCIISRLNGELFELDKKYYRALNTEDIFAVIR